MAAESKLSLSGLWHKPASRADSETARQIVRDTYQKAGGRPTAKLKRVYGEYLEYAKTKRINSQTRGG